MLCAQGVSQMRYWTCHWQNRHLKNNPEGKRISLSGSNLFSKRGVQQGDLVYIVSIRALSLNGLAAHGSGQPTPP
jgi:hypothetical protein